MLNRTLKYTLAFTTAIPCMTASATTLTVNTDGTADYQHIQDAVDAASDGDIIAVADGTTYTDTDGDGWVVKIPNRLNVTINPDVEDGMFQIDGDDSAGGFNYRFSGVSLEGVTFVDCTAEDGGGIYLLADDVETFELANCIFESCHAIGAAAKGGALCIQGASTSAPINATVTNCQFSGCSSESSGGAIFANYSTLLIDNAEFTGCSAKKGSAVHSRGVSIEINNSIFADNEWTNTSGSVVIMYNGVESSEISNCQFSSNKPASSSLDGQLIERRYGDFVLNNCSFTDNVDLKRGCIFLRDLDLTDTATISDCSFSGNTTLNAYSTSCILAETGVNLTLSSTQMCDHEANTEISGSYTDGGSLNLGQWCCPGDIDEDGDIDADDLVICIAGWDSGLGSDDREDLDRDESITVVDVLTLLNSWGPCS